VLEGLPRQIGVDVLEAAQEIRDHGMGRLRAGRAAEEPVTIVGGKGGAWAGEGVHEGLGSGAQGLGCHGLGLDPAVDDLVCGARQQIGAGDRMGLRIPCDDVVDQPVRPFRRKGCQCLDECGIVGLPVGPGCHRPAREGVDLVEIAQGRQVPQERRRGPVGAGLASAPFRVGPVDPNPFGEEMRLIPERRLRIGTGLLPCPDQLAEEGNADLQPALAEDRGAMPARPDDEGGALVEPIEAGAFVAGSLLKLELIRLQVVEHAGRGELIQLEGKRSQVRMAAVGMTPSVDELTALVDFADLELIVVVTAPIAAAGVLRPAGFLDRDQCEVEVAIGLARGADQETRSGGIGALEPVEPDFGRQCRRAPTDR
jgi:hypothetical protein